VDSTAPCGNPAVVVLIEEDSLFTWTVKLHPVRNALRIQSRYVGTLREMSLYRRPVIHTVS